MRIERHVLGGDSIDFRESPNQGGAFEAVHPDTIVLHYKAIRGRPFRWIGCEAGCSAGTGRRTLPWRKPIARNRCRYDSAGSASAS